MRPTISEAKRLAHKWASSQDLPTGYQVLLRSYDKGRGRKFSVVVKEPPRGQNFILTDLYVLDSGEIKVVRERVSRVAELFEKHGTSFAEVSPTKFSERDEAVDYFWSALKTAGKPNWFKEINPELRVKKLNGRDFNATIETLSSKLVAVPVKIVLGVRAKHEYNRVRSQQKIQRRVVMVITPRLIPEQIAKTLYHYLEEMRKNRIYL